MKRQFLILLIFFFSLSIVHGQIDLNKTMYTKCLYDIPNDSTIKLGNCPSVGQMDIEFQIIDYNAEKKILHIKGNILDKATKEILSFVTITHCILDIDKLKINKIKSYILEKDNSFDIKIQVDKGQCIVFRLIGYLPITFELDKLEQ